jgi:hypothetical protein
VLSSVGFILGGGWAQYKRRSAWERIKQTSNPVATPLIVPAEAVAVVPLGLPESVSTDPVHSAPAQSAE